VGERFGEGFHTVLGKGIEGKRMDGGGNSLDLRGGRAGCLSTCRSKGRTVRGKAAPGGRAKRRVERASRRWRRRTARRRPGEKNCGDGRIRAGEQEGSEEGDERGKRSRTHMQN
jgi:hypothetical protein